MIALRQMWHCPICGNVVEVIYVGGGELVCCGQPMQLLKENTVDAARSESLYTCSNDLGDKIEVSVGSIPHPMEEKHYITCIEVLTGKRFYARTETWRRTKAKFV